MRDTTRVMCWPQVTCENIIYGGGVEVAQHLFSYVVFVVLEVGADFFLKRDD